MIYAVIFIGPPGSGKTTFAAALSDELMRLDRAHGFVELDSLSQAHPPLPRSVGLGHLATIAMSLRERGRDLIIATATPETADELEGIKLVLGAEVLVVWLDAPLEVLSERLESRESEPWPRILTAVAQRLHGRGSKIAGSTALNVNTNAPSVEQALASVVERLG